MDNLQNSTTNNSSDHLKTGQNLNTNVKAPTHSAVSSYRDGYVHGRASERSLEQQRQEDRDEKTAARGLLIGIALTSLVGLVVGSLFLLNQQQESQTPVLLPTPSAPQEPIRETTIIERTQEVPVINQEPPTAPQDTQPDIQITIPSPGQQQSPAQQNTTPEVAPPTATQQNTAPQASPTLPQNQSPSSTSTTNQASPTESENQITTGTSTTTQPNTANQVSPGQSQSESQSGTSGSPQ